ADFASNVNRDPKHNTGDACRRGGRQESRPETQRGSRKTGEKGHKAYQKSRGNVPGGGRVWIKRRGDKSHRKRVVGNEKTGSMQRRGCQRRQGSGGGKGCQRRGCQRSSGGGNWCQRSSGGGKWFQRSSGGMSKERVSKETG
ncbi:hypothetical protein TNCV_859191, partial [Trichonephila clavipes]